jgi:pimeloyl-ACP methyl ester carboxylesterase
MHRNTDTVYERMPLTEKEDGEKVSYNFPVKRVSLNTDLEIAYIDEGKGENEAILFIHGMGSGIPVWEKNIKKLKKHFRCIALDLPGHGLSSRGDFSFTIEFYTRALISFIDKLGLTSISIAGHSLGGQIAFSIAIRRPDLAAKVIGVSPAGIEPYTSVEKQMLINMINGIVTSGNAYTKHRLNFMIGFCNNQEEAGELASKMAFYKNEAIHFGRMMQRTIQAILLESLENSLHKIHQPCLVIAGKQDKVSPYPYLRGREYYRLIALETTKMQNCKFVACDDCGHFMQYQKPEVFNNELMKFIQETEEKTNK